MGGQRGHGLDLADARASPHRHAGQTQAPTNTCAWTFADACAHTGAADQHAHSCLCGCSKKATGKNRHGHSPAWCMVPPPAPASSLCPLNRTLPSAPHLALLLRPVSYPFVSLFGIMEAVLAEEVVAKFPLRACHLQDLLQWELVLLLLRTREETPAPRAAITRLILGAGYRWPPPTHAWFSLRKSRELPAKGTAHLGPGCTSESPTLLFPLVLGWYIQWGGWRAMGCPGPARKAPVPRFTLSFGFQVTPRSQAVAPQ